MQKYIALLRGINVGGNNKIPMPELKAAFEENGYADVVTYINSGNIIFSSRNSNTEELKKECEAAIADKFKLNIAVAVISVQDLSDAIQNAPSWWDTDSESKHNAIFVIPPATTETVIGEVGNAKPEYERVGYYGQVIFWSAPLKTFSRTRWSKIAGTSAYGSITIRNANTAKKLLAIAEQG